tara:strand:+ start:12811 stop:13056 length:246 start_codon:yes stop_codon:yes gene_type:complete
MQWPFLERLVSDLVSIVETVYTLNGSDVSLKDAKNRAIPLVIRANYTGLPPNSKYLEAEYVSNYVFNNSKTKQQISQIKAF